MKNSSLYVIVMVLLLLSAGCRKDNPTDEIPKTGVATGKGTLVGQAVSKTIGSEGGILLAEDGRVELVVPAGALSGPVDISIQPVTDMIPLGLGRTYRLKPDGLQFAIPVELSVKVNPDELFGSSPDAILSAFQGDDNVWQAVRKADYNESEMKLSTRLDHFSDWGFLSLVRFSVSSEIADPEDEIQLMVMALPGAGAIAEMESGEEAPVGTPEPFDGEVTFEIDRQVPGPVERGSIRNSSSGTAYVAPPEPAPSGAVNLVNIIGRVPISPNQVYHLTQEISLGGTMQVTVNGNTYFMNQAAFLTISTSNGRSGLTGSSKEPMGSVSIGWKGVSVGSYTSGGQEDNGEYGFNTLEKDFKCNYRVPCSDPAEIIWLSCVVNLTRVNTEEMTAYGSFSGQVAYSEGKKRCESGIEEDEILTAEMSGYFKVRMAKF